MAIARKHLHTTLTSFNPQLPSHPDTIDLAMLALNDRGVIQHCSPDCEQVFGYRTDELAGHHVSTLLPELHGTELVMEDRINARLAFLCHCAIPFKARRRDGAYFRSELFINRLNQQNVVVLVRNLEVRR
ncbi:PAS domain S-box protein [Thiobacillus sp.]|uniref:PAS domain S-box protein n=1 Tax=Thiobacillus sp. TaxID=924 RepID=UPI0025FC5075|nr:PAS domain S-box protein [Thiobacillus sp.]MBT9539505.1 PAS domain S-box protein [Thiobacillus sp.]